MLVLGNESFKQVLRNKLFSVLHFSKVEQDKFVYLGCEIEKIQNGDVSEQLLISKVFISNMKVIEKLKKETKQVNRNSRINAQWVQVTSNT